MDEIALKRRLIERNPEFRGLYEEHQRCERLLATFEKKAHLTDPERLEEIDLKKKKLALKDRMYRIMSDSRSPDLKSRP